jgi:hypothetical protein
MEATQIGEHTQLWCSLVCGSFSERISLMVVSDVAHTQTATHSLVEMLRGVVGAHFPNPRLVWGTRNIVHG